MNYKSIFSAVGVVAAVSFFCVGCGGGSGKPSELVGHWVYYDGDNDIEKMELFKDGTGVVDGKGSVTWKVENKRFVILSSGSGMSCNYKVSGYYLTLIEDDGDSTKYIKKERWDIMEQAKQAFKRGVEADDNFKSDEAIAEFTEAIKLDPNYVDAYLARAGIYMGKEDYDKVIADVTNVIRIGQKPLLIATAYALRGSMYGEKKEHDKAIADFESALKVASSADDKEIFSYGDNSLSKKEIIEQLSKNIEEAKKAKGNGVKESKTKVLITTFTDNRDGEIYKKVTIATQTWMAENLNYARGYGKCYVGVWSDDCGKSEYGLLYTWSDAKKACPTGWHLPSNEEWATLEKTVGGSETAGKKLKSVTGWKENGNGTNEYGFSALPGGFGGRFVNSGDNLHYLGSSGTGSWWSVTEGTTGNAWIREMNYNTYDVTSAKYDKTWLSSVRCVED